MAAPAMIDTSWLPTREAAARLGVSLGRVRQLVDAERLRYVRTPLGLLIDPKSVQAFADWRQRVQDAKNSSAE